MTFAMTWHRLRRRRGVGIRLGEAPQAVTVTGLELSAGNNPALRLSFKASLNDASTSVNMPPRHACFEVNSIHFKTSMRHVEASPRLPP